MNKIKNSHAQNRLLCKSPDPITRGYSEPIEPSEGVQSLKEQRYIDIQTERHSSCHHVACYDSHL